MDNVLKTEEIKEPGIYWRRYEGCGAWIISMVEKDKAGRWFAVPIGRSVEIPLSAIAEYPTAQWVGPLTEPKV